VRIEKPLFLYALCGSQRKASTNRRLLEALRDNAPAGVVVEICELIGELPIFNPDREGENTPAIVEEFAATFDDVEVAVSDRIERTGIDGTSHASDGKC